MNPVHDGAAESPADRFQLGGLPQSVPLPGSTATAQPVGRQDYAELLAG